MSETVENHLYELGFAIPAESSMERYLSSPAPVELEDSKGQSWSVYRHVEFPQDLQLWVSKDSSNRIRLRRLGRLRETSYEFSSFSKKVNGRLEQAIRELSDLQDFMNG